MGFMFQEFDISFDFVDLLFMILVTVLHRFGDCFSISGACLFAFGDTFHNLGTDCLGFGDFPFGFRRHFFYDLGTF